MTDVYTDDVPLSRTLQYLVNVDSRLGFHVRDPSRLTAVHFPLISKVSREEEPTYIDLRGSNQFDMSQLGKRGNFVLPFLMGWGERIYTPTLPLLGFYAVPTNYQDATYIQENKSPQWAFGLINALLLEGTQDFVTLVSQNNSLMKLKNESADMLGTVCFATPSTWTNHKGSDFHQRFEGSSLWPLHWQSGSRDLRTGKAAPNWS
jgi:hypothetical protein